MTLLRDVEALLFSSGRAMSEEALASILDVDPKEVKQACRDLDKEYAERDTALKIFGDGGYWKMLVRDAHIPVVQRVVADTELSRPTMETLAVIAYHYPKILQSEVIHSRGSGAYDHIKELENAGFISRSPEGRSFSIKLTEKFFEYFDVEGEADIRDVFKDVKVPEMPEHLGELDVVDVPEEPENPFLERELGTKPEMTREEQEEQRSFLASMDEKIGQVSERNDESDKEPIFQPGEFEVEEPDEPAAEPDETPEATEESVAQESSESVEDDYEESSEDTSEESESPGDAPEESESVEEIPIEIPEPEDSELEPLDLEKL